MTRRSFEINNKFMSLTMNFPKKDDGNEIVAGIVDEQRSVFFEEKNKMRIVPSLYENSKESEGGKSEK